MNLFLVVRKSQCFSIKIKIKNKARLQNVILNLSFLLVDLIHFEKKIWLCCPLPSFASCLDAGLLCGWFSVVFLGRAGVHTGASRSQRLSLHLSLVIPVRALFFCDKWVWTVCHMAWSDSQL